MPSNRAIKHPDPLLKRNASTHSYLKWLQSQEGYAVAANQFEMKLSKQDDNFNEADKQEEKDAVLQEIADENAEAITETEPSDWSGYEDPDSIVTLEVWNRSLYQDE